MNLRFDNVDPEGEVALSLLREAALEARELYADTVAADAPWPKNSALGSRDVYIVAYLDERAVACGALREVDGVTAEVRRIYVLREHRRNRFGHAVLSHLAMEARRLGYETLRLESGNKQAAAIALYEAFGFHRIAPFGIYATDPTSVCFELRLDS